MTMAFVPSAFEITRYLAEDAAVDLSYPGVVAHLPGDPRRLRFAGSWLGKAEVIRMRTHWRNSFDGSIEPVRMVAEEGLVFAQIRLHGTFAPTVRRLRRTRPSCSRYQASD